MNMWIVSQPSHLSLTTIELYHQVGKSTVLRLVMAVIARHRAFGIGAPHEVTVLKLDLSDLPVRMVIPDSQP